MQESQPSNVLESLIQYVQAIRRVCPMPQRWQELWEMLPGRHRLGSGWEPQLPLVLSAWWATSASEKRDRLLEHLTYAASHGVLAEVDRFLRGLSVSEWAHEADFPRAPPFREHSYHEPKPEPDWALLDRVLQLLKREWLSVAGSDLSANTRPLRFAGRKARRLVVVANPHWSPPWGSWSAICPGCDRASFTAFRKRVNERIAPHAVDDIVFRTRRW